MGKKNHKSMPWMCGICKSGFASQAAVTTHARAAHAQTSNIGIYQRILTLYGDDHEPSLADRAVEAEIARAMGEHSDDDWLLGR